MEAGTGFVLSLFFIILPVGLLLISYLFKDSFYSSWKHRRYSSPLELGNFGEQQIYDVLLQSFPENHIFRNIHLMKPNGRYTEIDLIAVGKKGIYVFESKNYSGWIFGSGHQRMWMQTFPNGSKARFYNPVLQNRGHINALKFTLRNFPKIRYFSFIVFIGPCELKKIEVSSPDTYVLYKYMLKSEMTNIMEGLPDIITQEERYKIISLLSMYKSTHAA